jgi:hypothetical protein
MARDLIQQRAFDALGFRPPFNEVLSAAYMERQKMAVRFFCIRHDAVIHVFLFSSTVTASKVLAQT